MNNEGVLMSGKGLWTQGFIAGVPKAVSKSNQGGILTPGKGVFTKYIKLKKKGHGILCTLTRHTNKCNQPPHAASGKRNSHGLASVARTWPCVQLALARPYMLALRSRLSSSRVSRFV
jgi:hypothetical protein